MSWPQVSNRLPRLPPGERILVIRLGALGDVVRTLPALHVLREGYPKAHIAWLVEAAGAKALEGESALDEVVEFPRQQLEGAVRELRWISAASELVGFVAALRRRDFELVLDFHGILKSGLLSLATGARHRVGYRRPFARELSWVFANLRADLGASRLSRFDRNLGLVRFLGLDGQPPARPLEGRLGAGAGAERAGGAPILAHPGSSVGAAHKRYPPELLGRALAALHAETGRPCRVLAGAGEGSLAEAVVAAAGTGAALAPATPTFVDLLGELSGAALFISADTGPLHMASLVGTPVVQILGPTHPVENAPSAAAPSRSLRAGLACSPCRRGCAPALCMRLVSPEHVVAAGLELLQASS